MTLLVKGLVPKPKGSFITGHLRENRMLVQNLKRWFLEGSNNFLRCQCFMVDDSLWCDLRANTRCIDAMYLLSLDDIGVESMDDVENVEFTLRIIDEKWNDIAVSDVITLNFE